MNSREGINPQYTPVFFVILSVILFVTGLVALNAQEPGKRNRILFILDCSQSMSGHMGKERKTDLARKFIIHAVDSLSTVPNVEIALRAFGHQSVVPPQDCNDTRLEVPFSSNSVQEIKRKIRYLEPKGTTPIANSLAHAVIDFPPADDVRNIVILITDGIEACDGDPCEVAKELQRNGIMLKPFIIGIGLDPGFQKTFECMGNVYNASEPESFGYLFNVVITHALAETTMQINLLDSYGYPSETNVPMTFYDVNTGKMRYTFIHTINNRGNPDTLRIDPLTDYVVKIHTIPPVLSDTIRMAPGKHTTAAVDAPQGTLILNQVAGYQYRGLEFIVRKSGEHQSVSRQKIFTKAKYITGLYDLEIPTIPVTILNNVEIKQSQTTTVTLPQPGIVTLQVSTPGICELFVMEGNDMRWIYSVDTNEKSIPLTLLPGNYRLYYRAAYATESVFTIAKSFAVESGRSAAVKVF